jgi:hypothetical protein
MQWRLMVKGHRIQLMRFSQAKTAAWDAIPNLVAKRLLRLRRQLIVDRVRYRWGSCARRMNVSVGAESGSPARCLNGSLVAERIAMLPARLRR